MTTVLLIDDHAIVREGFKRLFETECDFSVIAEAANADSALAAARRHSPDVVILDPPRGGLSPGLIEALGKPATAEHAEHFREASDGAGGHGVAFLWSGDVSTVPPRRHRPHRSTDPSAP